MTRRVLVHHAKGKRSTPNAQRSTFKDRSSKLSSLNDERWALNVERFPALTVEGISVPPSTAAYIKKHLQAAWNQLDPPLIDLSLALIGDKKMSALHKQFLNIPGPTDVLTFPLETNKKGQPVSGEVVICVPEARRRCKENGVELRQELLLYALHGLLHLCGFDDRTDRQFQRMHRMEDQILTRLGVGPVFAAKGHANSHANNHRRGS